MKATAKSVLVCAFFLMFFLMPAFVEGPSAQTAGSISGTVTDQSGTPIAGAYVYAEDEFMWTGTAYTDANGIYTISELEAGSYRVYASADGYRLEYFDDTTDWVMATLVPLDAGENETGIDFALLRDQDNDGVLDTEDNCPAVSNGDQADMNGDGEGDACDPDADGDGTANDTDNCPYVVNPDQADGDLNGVGDACEPGSISGTVTDAVTGAPIAGASVVTFDESMMAGPGAQTDDSGNYTITDLGAGSYTVQAGVDGYRTEYYDNTSDIASATVFTIAPNAHFSGVDFALIPDHDYDGVADNEDNCPTVGNYDQADTDSDGIGDSCDPDADADGILNETDNCPLLDNADQADADGDGYGDACTRVYCVATSEQLYQTLIDAESNGKNDVIHLVQGIYECELYGSTFRYSSTEPFSLLIKGGYSPGCSSRVLNAENTVLEGTEGLLEGAISLTMAIPSPFPYFDLVLEGVKIQHGYREWLNGGALTVQVGDTGRNVVLKDNIVNECINNIGVYVNSSAAKLEIANNVIANNPSLGLYVYQSGGEARLIGNTISGNSGGNNGGLTIVDHSDKMEVLDNIIVGNSRDGLYVGPFGGQLNLINNTITGNSNHGVSLDWYFFARQGAIVNLYNNIIWGNAGECNVLAYGEPGEVISNAFNNDFDPTKEIPSFINEGGNLSEDPQFVDAASGNYHLSVDSPLINAGFSSVEGLPDQDFEGDDRILEGAVDIGADEYLASAATTHTIWGRITSGGAAVAGITVSLGGAAPTTSITNSNGYYRFTQLSDGDYTITPTNTLYEYDPVSHTATVNGTDIGGLDFVASPVDTDGDGVFDINDNCPAILNPNQADSDGDGIGDFCQGLGSISGIITNDSGVPIAGAYVFAEEQFVPVAAVQTYTDASGNYTISGLEPGNYRVYASANGYLGEYYDNISDYGLASVSVTAGADTAGIDFSLTSDQDGDGVADSEDNCSAVSNPDQADLDIDGTGDVCDLDIDGDGAANESDNCPLLDNSDQADGDGDGYGDACTEVRCVSTSAQLQQALSDAQSNGKNDVIKLVQGVYRLAENNDSAFSYSSSEPYSLLIKGGYTPGCASRALNAENTVLDGSVEPGSSTNGVLSVSALGGHLVSDLLVEGVTVQGGYNSGYSWGGALYLYTDARDVVLKDCRIAGNAVTGCYVYSGTGGLQVVNNVVAGNSNYGLYLESYGAEPISLVNNTFTENAQDGLYLALFGSSQVDFYNNILWGNNGTYDATVDNFGFGAEFNAYNNDFDPYRVSGQFTNEGGNLSEDPQFVDTTTGDYHLAVGSPLINSGSNTIPGLPATDFEGDARILDGTVDMGADESALISTTHTASGRVTSGGVGLSGITVSLTGVVEALRITDSNGYYRFSGLADGNYTVTPTNSFYDYDPETYPVAVDGADVGGLDFTASAKDSDEDGVLDMNDNCPDVHNPGQDDTDGDGVGDACDGEGSISGTVLNAAGDPIEGAWVYVDWYWQSANTDADGTYMITGLPNGEYRVQAGASGYESQYYQNVTDWSLATPVQVIINQDKPGINFSLPVDQDSDGFGDYRDNCPATYNSDQANMDGDGEGDVCDPDIDGDGVANESDTCPLADVDQADTDGDGYGDACTQVHCVYSSAELQQVLDAAAGNGINDIIKLAQGIYRVSENSNSQFHYGSNEPYSLLIKGGYAGPGCTSRELNADNTVLEGNFAGGSGSNSILYLQASASSYLPFTDVLVEGLSVLRGANMAGGSAALYVADAQRSIILKDNRLMDNAANGSIVSTSIARVELVNNVIANNSESGLYVYSNSGSIAFTNNTITDNSQDGLYLWKESSATQVDLYNNILSGNHGSFDVVLDNWSGATINAYNNNLLYPDRVSGVFTNEGSNLNETPGFVNAAAGDYHLAESSPLINNGENSAPELPQKDFEGDDRIIDGLVDIGADEYYLSTSAFAVSGRITTSEGIGVSGIEVNLSGDATASRITDSSGNYRFSSVANGSYTITPTSPFYIFTPTDQDVPVSGADVGSVDFTATAIDTDGDGVYDLNDNCPAVTNSDQTDTNGDGVGDACDGLGSISGMVSDENDTTIEGAHVQVYDNLWIWQGDTYTDASGNYTIWGVTEGSYRVFAEAEGYIGEYYANAADGDAATPVTVAAEQEAGGIDFTLASDQDRDGVGDDADKCPALYNPSQIDTDANGIGDMCDPDADGDGVPNAEDNCPGVANADQWEDDDGYGDACTVVHCVTDSTELQQALNDAAGNGMDDVIHLVQGTYSVADNGNSAFYYYSAEPFSLEIKGGYTENCSSRELNPANTILDGATGPNYNPGSILSLQSDSESNLTEVLVEGITLRNLTDEWSGSGALYATTAFNTILIKSNRINDNSVKGLAVESTRGKIEITNNVISNNDYSPYSNLGSSISCDYGDALIAGNLIYGNNSEWGGGGLYLTTSQGTMKLVNNTIADNITDSGSYGGGLYLQLGADNAQAHLYNNTFWGNSGDLEAEDLYIENPYNASVVAHNNNFDPERVTAIFTTEANNLKTVPGFVDAVNGDYHLAFGSPLINSGESSAPGLPDRDFEGDPRIMGNSVDIGADEYRAGGLTVTIEPAEAVAEGRWSIDSGATWRQSGESIPDLADGQYTVEFKPIDGWNLPDSQSIDLEAGEDASITGTYVRQTGSLKVTIIPQAAVVDGARWSIDDGTTWQTSGTDLGGLAVGEYTVRFSTLDAWVTPQERNVTVLYNQTVTETGEYVLKTGSLTVTINPAEAAQAGTGWSIDGGATWNASAYTMADLAVGDYEVQFKPIAGWNQPANRPVTIVAETDTPITGTYVRQTGSLLVTITPPDAVAAGAQWSIDGTTWHSSGTQLDDLFVGQYMVSFKPVQGWTTPQDQPATIEYNQTETVVGNYSQTVFTTGSLTVTINPPEAVQAGAQWRADGGTWMNSGDTVQGLSAGQHTLEFKAVAGFVKPANKSVTIVGGETTPLSETYRRSKAMPCILLLLE